MADAPWRCSECGTVNEPVANSCRTCGKWPSLFDLQESVFGDSAPDTDVEAESVYRYRVYAIKPALDGPLGTGVSNVVTATSLLVDARDQQAGDKPIVLVVYHSKTGNTKLMAEAVAAGARASGKVQVHLKTVGEATSDDVTAADAVIIGMVVVVNTAIGVVQEVRADKAIAALDAMAAPTARVVRDGLDEVLPADQLVVGDLVRIEAGDVVPADLRPWFECNPLYALTENWRGVFLKATLDAGKLAYIAAWAAGLGAVAWLFHRRLGPRIPELL